MKALKFKHIFGEPLQDKFQQIIPTTITCDSTMIKSNSKYTGFMWGSGGGGVLCVLENRLPIKVPMDLPMIKGHSASILDLDWYPFDDQYVATSSIDNTIKIWRVPEQFTADLMDAETTLFGHDKKINIVQWNPSAAFILASGSYDSTLKVWDVQKGEAAFTVQSTAQAPISIEWSPDGSIIGSTWNDKKVRIADPRASKFTSEVDGHLGTKPQRFAWLGSTGYYVTVGFNKNHDREYSLWNASKPEAPVQTEKIDSGSGVLFPHWDDALGLLYITGKGDSSIKYFEFQDGKLYFLNSFNSNIPGKGYHFLPRRGLNVAKCEVARVSKLEDKTIEFVSFVAPRKSTTFQEDLFPDCAAGVAALTSDQWLSGQSSKPKTQSMRPENMPTVQQGASIKFDQKEKPQTKVVTSDVEINQLKARIVELEADVVDKDRRIEDLETILNAIKVVESNEANQQPEELQQEEATQQQEEAAQE